VLSVTPISTPTDLFFDEDVSISCADLNMTLPVAEREITRGGDAAADDVDG
jgi:hypothetical protein